ncbi:LysR substrate-binding domain-containing protein [Tardiphaga sp.]|uniref:LysR substrate-binding domain-containing protein n=1 Tax=Tardiphaga sp. TaxID=1926292 RepID=UPI00260661C9|nr:LysR substrate-binding domain-containing protein [Tardiphaga sp.]MDB5617828.1 DNA-binding transcriptional regulator, LysR family [Tardiphaga sp.]
MTPKPALRLSAIDLNLLVVFDAILREKSVTRAGLLLGFSQPAMSHALTRLRHMLKDDLFVRSPKGMIPTPRAEHLAEPIRSALDSLQQSLEPTKFDPHLATRTFNIAVDNYSAVVLVPEIMSHIAGIAPQLRLDIRPSGTLNIPEILDRSEIDLVIGRHKIEGERFSTKRLLQDRFVVVYRKGHPAGRKTFSPEKLASLSRLDISSAQFGVDVGLPGSAKPKQRPTMRAPFLSAAKILSSSNMISILPLNVARDIVTRGPLAFAELTGPAQSVDVYMSWPRRLDNQPAHSWLRRIIGQVSSEL